MSNSILIALLCFSVFFGLMTVLHVLIKEEMRIRDINKRVEELLKDSRFKDEDE